MNFARRATIALVTGILTLGGFAVMASPAEAKADTHSPSFRDTGWP
jgi:hypothetical protein